jgi:hypothetical protein
MSTLARARCRVPNVHRLAGVGARRACHGLRAEVRVGGAWPAGILGHDRLAFGAMSDPLYALWCAIQFSLVASWIVWLGQNLLG